MFLQNTKLRVKLFVLMLTVILIPTVSVSSIIFKKAENAIKHQTSKAIISSICSTVQNVDAALKNIQYSGIATLYDESFNKRLMSIAKVKTRFDEYTAFDEYTYLKNLFTSLSYQYKEVYSYNIYLNNQKSLISTRSSFYFGVDEKKVSFLEGLKNKKLSGTWFISRSVEEEISSYSDMKEYPQLVTFLNLIKEGENTLGILAINVDEDFIKSNFIKVEVNPLIDSVVLDENSNIVTSKDKSLIGKQFKKYSDISDVINKSNTKNGSFTYKIDKGNYLVIFDKSAYTGWKYVKIIPENYVIGEISDIKNFLVLVLLITGLVIMGITYFLSYIFYKPIEKLVKAMQRIENKDLSVRIEDTRKDEYHKVYQGFNDMVVELKKLMNDLTSEKILKKEAEIKFLQAQINPHFLYNTLESIHSIAKIYKVREISLMVAALSKFFRISLSGGKEIVTLREAIDLVKSYLTIQNIRFKGKINYEINVAEELLEYKVPKLILQPIVENSIYHGIEKKKGNGLVNIIGSISDYKLKLVVKDDGIGIEQEKLTELLDSINSCDFEDTSNFALKNLNQQIKLKHGDDYGISISSEYGKGTNVSITLPGSY